MKHMLLEKILLFLAGGAVGGFTVGMIVKSKYEKEIDDEVADRLEDEVAELEEIYKERYTKFDQNENDPDEDGDEDEENTEFLKEVSRGIVDQAVKARNKQDVKDIIERKGYTNYSRTPEEPTRNPELDEEYEPEEDEIEIISPEEFGEIRDYDQQTLYYLRDKILVDDEGNPIEDIGKWVSYEALDEFGAYGESDSVYVRNHHFKTDIGIFLRDETLANFSG